MEKIIRDYFPYITETETTTFTDCVNCLIAFTNSRFNKEISLNAMYHYVFSVQDSFEEQITQGSFVSRGRQDVFAVAIGRLEHPGRVRAAGVGVTIKQYFGLAPRMSHSSSSLPPEELQQLTQQIRDQLEESITEKVMRQLMASFSQMQSQLQS